jgi:hypothetical protein
LQVLSHGDGVDGSVLRIIGGQMSVISEERWWIDFDLQSGVP